MRSSLLCFAALAALGAVGCGSTQTTYVKSETTLGRVVVYRNGVAYFERYADVQGDSLKLNVPQDKVDDFLKSLTVVDAQTGEPAPISYPSGGSGGTIDMKVGVGKAGQGPRRLRLSYVTEAPSWKPSYRVVVNKAGKVDLQGWAIVDNTSGEDWRDVKLGVGASSAMSFRFDLKGLRLVERETLRENDLFAQAPPMGGAAYGAQNGPATSHRVVADVSDDVLTSSEREEQRRAVASATTTVITPRGGSGSSGHGTMAKPADARPMSKSGAGDFAANAAPPAAPDPIQRMAQSLRASQQSNTIVVEGYASSTDKDKNSASLERANRLRDQLVRNGLDPNKVVALGKGEQAGRAGGARVVETPIQQAQALDNTKLAGKKEGGDGWDGQNDRATHVASATASGSEPIGTSHFESTTTMSVPRGTSAMVSILRSETDGEVVYLYDPESPRGNTQYPFKTLRFRNPTDSALESGPVSVFGEGRFVGEGLADPIPAKSVAFVPFALDRQIVVERKDAERDDIAKIITVQRGVFSTQIQHTKRATFTLYNRMPEKASVYLRHTVAQGYKLTKSPERSPDATSTIKGSDAEHLAGAHLFRVELEPNGKVDVVVEEATPVFRSTDIRTAAGIDLVRAYLSSAVLDGPLKGEIEKLLKLNAEMTKIEQQISTAREQMGEYRQRMDELHAQLVTLKAVKTAGPLMAHLEKKLQEVSEKLSKATVDVVALQEKQMVARIQFQTGVGDLTLEGKDDKATAAK
jgi:outer membrane protein OmpA-like peptidoglycan-associated protein